MRYYNSQTKIIKMNRKTKHAQHIHMHSQTRARAVFSDTLALAYSIYGYMFSIEALSAKIKSACIIFILINMKGETSATHYIRDVI